MKADSILEETWRVKDELAREADYDVRKIFDALRAHERAHADVPRIRSVEELQQLVAEKERQRAGESAMALNDKPPRKP